MRAFSRENGQVCSRHPAAVVFSRENRLPFVDGAFKTRLLTDGAFKIRLLTAPRPSSPFAAHT